MLHKYKIFFFILINKLDKNVISFKKSIENLKFNKLSSSFFNCIKIDYYGKKTSLNQLANIFTENYRTLIIQVWNIQDVNIIYKSIVSLNLNTTFYIQNNCIKVIIPMLTQEYKHKIINLIKEYVKSTFIIIRNNRRDILKEIKKLNNSNLISLDEYNMCSENIEKIIKFYFLLIKNISSKKIDNINIF